MQQTQVYMGPDVTEASMFGIAARYAGWDAMVEAVGAAGSVLDLRGQQLDDRPVRFNCGITINGDDDDIFAEDLMIVRPTLLDGAAGVVVEKVADIDWTCGATAVPAAAGGRSGHKDAKAVSITSTGLIEARGSGSLGEIDGPPSLVILPDVRPLWGIVRLGALGTPAPTGAGFLIDAWARQSD